ncbi:hypothetical protein O181_030637 [Austropuccinia psidii MF-1]|uniref:Uncharacterized protein n=1 Tax=Austropuccinia psidii MF-1 TaxID=1389203 RepID=A0A9Q3CZ21_9BASI|nr:hypothetical protein [Austropuccinia psidii MF-1]
MADHFCLRSNFNFSALLPPMGSISKANFCTWPQELRSTPRLTAIRQFSRRILSAHPSSSLSEESCVRGLHLQESHVRFGFLVFVSHPQSPPAICRISYIYHSQPGFGPAFHPVGRSEPQWWVSNYVALQLMLP